MVAIPGKHKKIIRQPVKVNQGQLELPGGFAFDVFIRKEGRFALSPAADRAADVGPGRRGMAAR